MPKRVLPTILIKTIFAAFTIFFAENSTAQPAILLNGTWAIDINKDPFANKFPPISYLPSGTILFDIANAPLGEKYFSALTHNGFWVQIASPSAGGPNIATLADLNVSVPSDSLFFHRSILCLSDTNRITEPHLSCDAGLVKSPVGEGWLFHFEETNPPGWVHLKATIGTSTLHELQARGWNQLETEFDAKMDDLKNLESKGFLTLLNRNYPVVSFSNKNISPVLIKCGAKTVTQQQINAAVSAEASIGAEASFFGWVKAKIGLKTSTEASTSQEYTIEIDTTEYSYLFYSISAKDHENNSTHTINFEKSFECESGPQNDFGKRITSVTVEIDPGGDLEPVVYKFDDPTEYASMPSDIFDFSLRPLFLSLNSPSSYAKAVSNTMKKWGIKDRRLAEFVISNLNYTCAFSTRQKCDNLVSED